MCPQRPEPTLLRSEQGLAPGCQAEGRQEVTDGRSGVTLSDSCCPSVLSAVGGAAPKAGFGHPATRGAPQGHTLRRSSREGGRVRQEGAVMQGRHPCRCLLSTEASRWPWQAPLVPVDRQQDRGPTHWPPATVQPSPCRPLRGQLGHDTTRRLPAEYGPHTGEGVWVRARPPAGGKEEAEDPSLKERCFHSGVFASDPNVPAYKQQHC